MRRTLFVFDFTKTKYERYFELFFARKWDVEWTHFCWAYSSIFYSTAITKVKCMLLEYYNFTIKHVHRFEFSAQTKAKSRRKQHSWSLSLNDVRQIYVLNWHFDEREKKPTNNNLDGQWHRMLSMNEFDAKDYFDSLKMYRINSLCLRAH